QSGRADPGDCRASGREPPPRATVEGREEAVLEGPPNARTQGAESAATRRGESVAAWGARSDVARHRRRTCRRRRPGGRPTPDARESDACDRYADARAGDR